MNLSYRCFLFSALAAAVLTPPAAAQTFTSDLQLIPAGDFGARRWEVRAMNADGSLLLGNFQSVDLLTDTGTSTAVYWVRAPGGWEIRSVPGTPVFAEGFQTLSAINTGDAFVMVGRARREGRMEGLAYNYVAQETHWGGRLPGVAADVDYASRFTGVNAAGDLFAGSAIHSNGWSVPVISRWGEALEEIPLPDGSRGGWLYAVDDDADHGAGFLSLVDDEGHFTRLVPARWTPAEGMVALPDAYETEEPGLSAISRDGRYILGDSRGPDGVNAPTLWDRDNDFAQTFLPFPEDDNAAFEFRAGNVGSISTDGTLKFGSVLRHDLENPEGGNEWHAVVWHADNSVEYIADYVMREHGLALTEGRFRSANRDERGPTLFGGVELPDGTIAPFVLRVRARANGFQLLGHPSGSTAFGEARAIADTGDIAAVAGGMNGEVPFRWSAAEGWRQLPFPAGAAFTPVFLPANAITPDGSVIAGRTVGPRGTPVAFIHSVDGGFTSFGYASEAPAALSRATGISHAGDLVVGDATRDVGQGETQNHAALWSANGAIQWFDVPADAGGSWAYSISGDGSTAAGWITRGGLRHPAVWDTATLGYSLLPVTGGFAESSIYALSVDGSVAVGVINNGTQDQQAVYWENGGAPVAIPALPSGTRNIAWSVTDDGHWIAGQTLAADSSGAEGFLYHRGLGPLSLADYMLRMHGRLIERGVTPRVLHISPGGNWLSGDIQNPAVDDSRLPFRVKVPADTLEDYFDDAAPVGGTAFRQTWFGLIEDTRFPVVHHAEHGWLSLAAWGEDGGFAHDARLGWLHINRDTYPYLRILRCDGSSRWYFYAEGTTAPRDFYDIAAGVWTTDAALAP
ncbi:MAG: hypothetical protein JJU00_19665 [Opitutales bacterium]|nr:hypothetical protein [Opitutales bacterium]